MRHARVMAKKRRSRQQPRVSREEFATIVRSIEQHRRDLERCRHDLDIQFKRTAQVQAELEELQRTLKKLALTK